LSQVRPAVGLPGAELGLELVELAHGSNLGFRSLFARNVIKNPCKMLSGDDLIRSP
jgi:hypothetical protein